MGSREKLPNVIHTEIIIKLFDEENVDRINELFDSIYCFGVLPFTHGLHPPIVTLVEKKTYVNKCYNYGMI